MEPKLTIDTHKFGVMTRAIAGELKQDLAEALKGQAKLYVQDCVALTPPFVPPGFAKDKLAPQKKQGLDAVKRDIEGAFKPMKSLRDWIENGSTWFRKHPDKQKEAINYLETKQIGKLSQMMQKLKRGNDPFIEEANKHYHQKVRGSRGHVLGSAKSHPYIVERAASIKRLLHEKQANVGLAKSGWKLAAMNLGLKLPPWITKHNGQGVFSKANKSRWPEITLGNGVAYIQAAGSELNIMREAMRQRLILMERQFKITVAKNLQRASRRK